MQANQESRRPLPLPRGFQALQGLGGLPRLEVCQGLNPNLGGLAAWHGVGWVNVLRPQQHVAQQDTLEATLCMTISA